MASASISPFRPLNLFTIRDHLSLHKILNALFREGVISENPERKSVRDFWRYRPDLNWGMRVLQTLALPLGHGTILDYIMKLGTLCVPNILKLERVTRLELATSTLAR